MRFVILTFYYKNYNYGGLLQAYALQQAVESLNVKCDVLSYQYRCSQKASHIKKAKRLHEKFEQNILSGICYVISRIAAKGCRYIIRICYKDRLNKRQRFFEDFEQKIPHSTKVYHTNQLSECVESYDGFICGGDQIWNNWGHYDQDAVQGFTLEFVPDNKIKFAYAPSTGTIFHTKEFEEKLESGLKRLDYVSVREKSSVPYIEKICGKKAVAVLDPVMLLEKEQWENIIRKYAKSDIPKEKYILAYFLGKDKKQRKVAKQLANMWQMKLVTFPFIEGVPNLADIGFGNVQEFKAGPLEFVHLIQNAEMILTDSFHGSVFSIIFEKDFFVFERDTKVDDKDMNIRIDDLLDEFGLSKRKVQAKVLLGEENLGSIDYRYVSAILAQKRKESVEYLDRALKGRAEK